jgi:ligand-binding sensor domain-containing protein
MGTLWVAHAHGIDRFDPVTQDFRHFRPPEIDAPEFHYAAEDLQGALWMARTGDGLDRFDPKTGHFTHYGDDPADKHSISSGRVFSVFVDRTGTVWVATFAGLDKFNPASEVFTRYAERNGLPANTVLGIQQDESGYLWVSTSDGLARFDPRTGTSTNYHSSDGLPSDLFSIYVTAVRSRFGELFFGSYSGLVSFFPHEVATRNFGPPVVLTGFRVSGETITVGRGPLDRPIWAARLLTLPPEHLFI